MGLLASHAAIGKLLGTGPSGSGVTFDPLTLSPAIWLDASQESYEADDPVTTAHDFSGNGRDFAEATNPPIFKTSSAPVRPYFNFTGSQQLIKAYTGSGTDFSVLGVVSRKYDLFQLWWTNGIDPYFGFNTSRCPIFYQGAAMQSVYSEMPADIDENVLIGVISDNGTTKIILGRNIVAVGATTPNPLKVGGLSSLGGYKWEGHIHEVLATETALSFADWNAYEAYLRAKWGLANRRRIIFDGTSIVAGAGASIPANAWVELLKAELGDSWHATNTAISGQTVGNCIAGGGPAEYCLLNAATQEWTTGRRTDGKNILVIDAPTNDPFYGKTGEQAYASHATYCAGARAAGNFVITSKMLDRSTSAGSWTRAKRDAFDALAVSNQASFCDVLLDPVAVDSRFDDHTSALFADGIHLSDAGHVIFKDIFKSAILAANLS